MKKLLKDVFRTVGIDAKRYLKPPPAPLIYHGASVLLDVGANEGQYASTVRDLGYKGQIVSFEPLPHAHSVLSKRAQSDPRWEVHERCALGADVGEIDINVSQNSVSSSILQMLPSHITAAPNSYYVCTRQTKLTTIDSIYELYCNKNEVVFLKIDTQGYEREVLDGAIHSLPKIKLVQLEMSIMPLYEGQALARYFFDFFEKNGFLLWDLQPGFMNPLTGQLMQYDAVFVRR